MRLHDCWFHPAVQSMSDQEDFMYADCDCWFHPAVQSMSDQEDFMCMPTV